MWIYDRIVKNWKTTIQGLVPAIVVIGGYFGYNIDPAKLLIMFSGVYAVIKMLSAGQGSQQS